MKEGPNIAIIAALVGDPARANMLNALLGGAALTASELAAEAGVTLQTASSHLSKLQQALLIEQEQQGRHRYFRLASSDVADVLEGLGTLAARAGHLRVRPGPKDPAMRRARMCYDHLAGELGVRMFDSLVTRKLLTVEKDAIEITPKGTKFVAEFGVDLEKVQTSRRPLCKKCLDWSERRSHLGGTLGAAILDHVVARRWAVREAKSRVVRFSPAGEQKLKAWFSR
jgi:DNA-binding transcriptional ArsR family regulator